MENVGDTINGSEIEEYTARVKQVIENLSNNKKKLDESNGKTKKHKILEILGRWLNGTPKK